MVLGRKAALLTLLATLACASPVERAATGKHPIFKKANKLTASELVTKEKARIASFAAAATTGSATVINEDVSYIAVTTVGTQTFDLIVDTGSSNTWVGSGTKYVKSSTGSSTGKTFSVSYGSGTVSGTEYTDTVSLGGVSVVGQSIGVATKSSGFTGVDGILGVGPVILTQGTVSGVTEVPTFLDNLYSEGTIATEALGVFFAPESGSDEDDSNGELTIGGVDTSKYTGTLTYFAKSTTSPYSYYWGIATASLSYGSTSLESAANAIVDTGTTLIYIPTAAFDKYLTASAGTLDSTEGLIRWSTAPTSNFNIVIGSVTYALTPAQQIIPTAQLAVFGLSTKYTWGWINDGGSVAADVNFIIGQKFLENYYSVFDTTNSRLGFATAA